MCDNCSAVVGELNRQTYRLRVCLHLERQGWNTENVSIYGLHQIAEGFKKAHPAFDCAVSLTVNPEVNGLEKRHENHPYNS